MSQDLINSHYNATDLAQLASGVDMAGVLPSTAAAAADRLGWRHFEGV
jgi:hypothetical protein